MKSWNTTAKLLCASLLCGCAAPVYQLPPSEASAYVRFVDFDTPHICLDGEIFALSPDDSGTVQVPAGKAIHLRGLYSRNSGRCFPGTEFTPQPGQTYDVVNEAQEERCMVTVARHDPSANYGLRLETNAARTRGSCKNP